MELSPYQERTVEEKVVLQGKERFHVTPLAFVKDAQNDMGRSFGSRTGYLEGLRGIFTVFTLLLIFFRVFAPAIQTDTDRDGVIPSAFVIAAPAWQNTLRKVMAPIFWNSTLTPHFYIIFSGRVVLQTYIERRAAIPLAGAAFRRPFRLLVPAILGLTFASILSVTGAFTPGISMAQSLQSNLAYPAPIWISPIEYFNSLVAFFFADYDFSYYDRAFAFIQPAGIAWILPIIFQQTYTCVTLAYILPYTRLHAKIVGYVGFALLCYWVGSWAWYSMTGLLVCEFATVYASIVPSSFPLRWRKNGSVLCRIPIWVPAVSVCLIGVLQKFLWMSFPSYRDHEYVAHTDILTAGLVRNLDSGITPFPRIDDWMVVTGLLLTVELLPKLQSILDNALLKHVGRLSYSIMLTSGSIYTSLGAYIHNQMVQQHNITNPAALLAILFLSCVPVAILVAEAAHWSIEIGTIIASRWLFAWMRLP
ncbi:hypothetical protein CBS101457_006041 [Exobasidium rhododendri]|nr:hypothetical protein CBS101457_006041 [Exobasidium rhododendri]